MGNGNEVLTLKEIRAQQIVDEARITALEDRAAAMEERVSGQNAPKKEQRRGTNPLGLTDEQRAKKHQQLMEGKAKAKARRAAEAAAAVKVAESETKKKAKVKA